MHELGHGTMSKYLGGKIAQIMLWPLGGICFSTRDPNLVDKRKKIKNELKIVWAGPVTHFFQAPVWMGVLAILGAVYKVDNVGEHIAYSLIPLQSVFCGIICFSKLELLKLNYLI